LNLARSGARAQFFMAWTLLLTAISPHQITHCTKLGIFWCIDVLLPNEHHCKNNGVKRPSGW